MTLGSSTKMDIAVQQKAFLEGGLLPATYGVLRLCAAR
jgi:hypothetical protein